MLDHCVVLFWLCSIVMYLHGCRLRYFSHAWANSAAPLILSSGHDFQRAGCNDYRVCDVVCVRMRLSRRDTFIEGLCFYQVFRPGVCLVIPGSCAKFMR